MNLTPHFTLEELTFTNHREFDNTPNQLQIDNLQRLAEFLEEVRELLGKPIIVDSGFRSPEVNQAVGSTSVSQHLRGCAADIRVPSMTPAEVVKAIYNSDIRYDQLILELTWTHISIPNTDDAEPRNMALIIDRQGTRAYA
jgi:zinc D-Ala-D-Ala carboxypeptidase